MTMQTQEISVKLNLDADRLVSAIKAANYAVDALNLLIAEFKEMVIIVQNP